jgi:hypothetical protein
MALVFSQEEFEAVKHFVALSVANKLRIQDPEFQSVRVLEGLIAAANATVGRALSGFLSAYDTWYQFHASIDAAGKSGGLRPAETAELARLVNERDDTRSTLLRALKDLDFPGR